MSHKRKNTAVYNTLRVKEALQGLEGSTIQALAGSTLQALGDFKVGQRTVESPSLLTYVPTIGTHQQLAGAFMQEVVTFSNQALTVIDSGGALGGWVSEELFAPGSRYVALVGYLDVEVLSVDAGINEDGTVNFGIGAAAATNGGLSGGAMVNLAAACAVDITTGAGSNVAAGPPIPTFVTDLTTYDGIHFNVGVADADITADADVTFNATVRLFLLDLAGA
jgi:hypothetical protein